MEDWVNNCDEEEGIKEQFTRHEKGTKVREKEGKNKYGEEGGKKRKINEDK